MRINLILLAVLAGCVELPADTGAGSPVQQTSGREIYNNFCITCHGADGRGYEYETDLLDGEWHNTTPDPPGLREVLTHGIAGSRMPAFQGILIDEEMRAVVDYVLDSLNRPTPQPAQ